MNFQYGEREVLWLSERDPVLGAQMREIGRIEREVLPDPFVALMSSIAAQQVSGRAYQTVWARISARTEIAPEAILEIPEEELARLGVGPKKARWMRAAAMRAGELIGIGALSDAEAVGRLMSFDGVGRWTAEMLLIFSLNRMDVLSKGDFGIRKGLSMLHGEGAVGEFDQWRARYAPYGSVASLYLWEIASGGGIHAEV